MNAPIYGYASSPLEINKKTVVKVEGTTTDRTNWTALSILKREEYLVSLIENLAQQNHLASNILTTIHTDGVTC